MAEYLRFCASMYIVLLLLKRGRFMYLVLHTASNVEHRQRVCLKKVRRRTYLVPKADSWAGLLLTEIQTANKEGINLDLSCLFDK